MAARSNWFQKRNHNRILDLPQSYYLPWFFKTYANLLSLDEQNKATGSIICPNRAQFQEREPSNALSINGAEPPTTVPCIVHTTTRHMSRSKAAHRNAKLIRFSYVRTPILGRANVPPILGSQKHCSMYPVAPWGRGRLHERVWIRGK
jgi:hypothetical protein